MFGILLHQLLLVNNSDYHPILLSSVPHLYNYLDLHWLKIYTLAQYGSESQNRACNGI